LYDALQRFNGISDIGVYDFKNAKNVRNPLISKILVKYDEENRD
jgi:phosphate starvation-inducible protein PhoH